MISMHMAVRVVIVAAFPVSIVLPSTTRAQLVVKHDLTVGGAASSLDLTAVRNGVALDDGGLLLAQDRVPEIVQLAPNGKLVRTIGRAGSGPGEFRAVSRVGLRGDTIWVADPTAQRISLFTLKGALLSTLRGTVAPVSIYAREMVAGYLGGGGILIFTAYPDQMVASGAARESCLLRFARGERVHIAALRTENSIVSVGGSKAGGWHLSMTQPFRTAPLWDVSPDGTCVGVLYRDQMLGGKARLLIQFFPRGDSLYTQRSFEVSARETSSVAVDQWLEATVDRLTKGHALPPGVTPAEVRAALRDSITIPKYQTPAEFLVLRDGCEAWIGLQAGPFDREWVVIPASGQIASVHLPPVERVIAVGRHHAWTTFNDDLDVPILKRYLLGER